MASPSRHGLRAGHLLRAWIALSCCPRFNAYVPSLSLLIWNPHWQCFVWNQINCSGHAFEYLETMLLFGDIDFAGLVEFGFESHKHELPERWRSVRKKCRHDIVDLVYDTKRWQRSGVATSARGCMVEHDRPFVIEQFERLNDVDASPVIVIAAHFPHPDIHTLETHDMGKYERTLSVLVLASALQRVLKEGSTKKVVLIADTNSWEWVPSKKIMQLIQAPKGDVLSTSLEHTCCVDVNFTMKFAFDRIMANFGYTMLTSIQFRHRVPPWAIQSYNGSVAAFHKPVRGTLVMEVKDVEAKIKRTKVEFIVSIIAGVIIWASCCVCYGLSLNNSSRASRRAKRPASVDMVEDSEES